MLSSLDPSFRAQELSFVVSQIARNVDLAAAAERRTLDRPAARPPAAGLAGGLAAAQERAGAHVERHSLWLQNSVRGAVGLGLAVLVADLTGAQHAFWVVFGTLVGAALERAQHRAERAARAARHDARLRRRRGARVR